MLIQNLLYEVGTFFLFFGFCYLIYLFSSLCAKSVVAELVSKRSPTGS